MNATPQQMRKWRSHYQTHHNMPTLPDSLNEFNLPHQSSVTVDESVREDERSNDEEKDEDIESSICQLLNQRTASQRRDKSCAPSH